MARWRYRIPVKQHFVDDPTDENIAVVVDPVVAALKQARDYATDEDLQTITGTFEDVRSIEDFDEAMTDLYDWADMNLVWVE